jgi:signal peptidase I
VKEKLKKIFDSKIGIILYIIIGIALVYFLKLQLIFYVLVIIGVPLLYFFKRDWLPYIFGGVLLAAIVHLSLAVALGNSFPVVAVVSGSMDHGLNSFGLPCSKVQKDYVENFDNWWGLCGDTYTEFGITKEQFQSFPFKDGFKIGDLPIIQNAETYHVGDIIVYDADEAAPIIHRIVKINADGTYQTKGDHNLGQNDYEDLISLEQIAGRVIFIIPKVGYFKVLTSGLL